MKSFKQFISEARTIYVKGWIKSGKFVTNTTDFSNYHILQVFKNPSKFGLSKNKLLKLLEDSFNKMDAPDPKKEAKQAYRGVEDGSLDNHPDIEKYLAKKGYCKFVIDKVHGSIEGWDEKTCRAAAKVLDDKYLPFEMKGFKLFEVNPYRPLRPKYITSKYDWYAWLDGKKAAGKRTEIGSAMAQFREEYITELFDKPYSFKSVGKLPSEKLFKWAYSDEIDMGDEEGDVANYTFKTDDNRTFIINFNYTVTPMKVVCKIDFDDVGAGLHYLTGKGDAMRILTTVLFAIKKELKRSKPDYVEFSSQKAEQENKTGRTKLYTSMVKRFTGKMGYNLKTITDHKYKYIFVLVKK